MRMENQIRTKVKVDHKWFFKIRQSSTNTLYSTHRGIGVFGDRLRGGGVDRDQRFVRAPVQLGVVVAVEWENLQEGNVIG